MEIDERLLKDLPDREGALRFFDALVEKHPSHAAKLARQQALLSDVLTLAAFSPLLSTTLLQNPEYLWWLARKRSDSGIRSTEELLESLARFSLTNSTLEPQVLFARFRRRELLRIFLRDIRRLATVPEITEEISNLADAVLASALDLARREIDNRFGRPQIEDEKGRRASAEFCIAALGKLGSRELNYSSDIDLIFIYSDDGETAGGTRGTVTNREYFVKLAEHIVKLTSEQSGEGAAYRVDVRLRPHGRLGPLAVSLRDMIRYYQSDARAWERQVMIRSRGCAGDTTLFREFFASIEERVFSTNESVASALANVRRSKELIDKEQANTRGYNVKLGRGGVREIEFIAQALQLAYGGDDKWLRFPHTLVSLSRLTDRRHLRENELTGLSAAYEFLRRTEHVLQMENGLQTHTIPENETKRSIVAARVEFAGSANFEDSFQLHTGFVQSVFERIFGQQTADEDGDEDQPIVAGVQDARERIRDHVFASIAKSDAAFDNTGEQALVLDRVITTSPHFASMLATNPQLAAHLCERDDSIISRDYSREMLSVVEDAATFRDAIAAMRRAWHRFLIEIVVADIDGKVTIGAAKRLQTELAEASIEAAIQAVSIEQDPGNIAVLALGKLGGRGIDYDSDLDLIFVSQDGSQAQTDARSVEQIVTALSSMTRDGSMYRVDLRLRPYGSKGLTCNSSTAFLDYMRATADPWEFLAFVKLRAAGGNTELGNRIETETRRIIHERAFELDAGELAVETRRVRHALEEKRTRGLRLGEIDIKYGSGGLLDIYFAIRFLQLRDNVPDEGVDRSTQYILTKLLNNDSLADDQHASLSDGHQFLSALDHNIRLIAGRKTTISQRNHSLLDTIADRMDLSSHAALIEDLTLHRLAIRAAFDSITGHE